MALEHVRKKIKMKRTVLTVLTVLAVIFLSGCFNHSDDDEFNTRSESRSKQFVVTDNMRNGILVGIFTITQNRAWYDYDGNSTFNPGTDQPCSSSTHLWFQNKAAFIVSFGFSSSGSGWTHPGYVDLAEANGGVIDLGEVSQDFWALEGCTIYPNTEIFYTIPGSQ